MTARRQTSGATPADREPARSDGRGEGASTAELARGPAAETCEQCGDAFRSAQGLAGHRRLAHSATARYDLDAREAELAEREILVEQRSSEIAARQRELYATGPASLGLTQCENCRAWFGSPKERQSHARTVHPIQDDVAEAVGLSRRRVDDVWIEAARKQEANPDKDSEWVVNQFWLPGDKNILRALLERNARFSFAEKED